MLENVKEQVVLEGIIIKGIGGFYYVKSADANITECRARGIFRRSGIKPTVGDRVEFENANIEKIFPRKSYLIRPAVANIDNLVIVIAAKDPEPDLFLTDKLAVAAAYSGIRPIICINKSDLACGDAIACIYSDAGYETLIMSCKEESDTKPLLDIIDGKVSAFAGLSGVGKSSILNMITGQNTMTGEVSKINRGRHTTRHVELFEIKKGTYILDTPGFSSLLLGDICDIKAPELEGYFPEFQVGLKECRFKGCSHINEPECGVKSRVECGKISQSRYDSYVQLYTQLKQKKEWEK